MCTAILKTSTVVCQLFLSKFLLLVYSIFGIGFTIPYNIKLNEASIKIRTIILLLLYLCEVVS